MDPTQPNPDVENARTVCVRVFNDRLAAETAADILESNGIMSCIHTDDCGGLTQLISVCGARLLVPSNDTERANELLAVYFPEKPASKRGLFVPCNPPRAKAQIIVVVGVGFVFGGILFLQLNGLHTAAITLQDGLVKFFSFWWSALCIGLVAYTLFRAGKNYFVQRKRAAKNKP